jgi:hypothetical protein
MRKRTQDPAFVQSLCKIKRRLANRDCSQAIINQIGVLCITVFDRQQNAVSGLQCLRQSALQCLDICGQIEPVILGGHYLPPTLGFHLGAIFANSTVKGGMLLKPE